MSLFDQPYYALSKAHMAQMGIWPEQSKYVRRIRLLTVVAITMTIAGPMLIGFYVTWGDVGTLIRGIPNILIGIGIYVTALRYVQHFYEPYYALTKAHMSRMGVWPEQSKIVRIMRPLTFFAMIMTLAVPVLIRWYNTWRYTDTHFVSLIHDIPTAMIGILLVIIMFKYIQHFDKIKLTFKNIERHWEMLKNTPAVIVLDKYAEHGRYHIVVYSMCLYFVITLYLVLYMSPTILDFIHPLNETRPKMYIFINVEYGIDVDKYYWLIIAHQYIVAVEAIRVTAAVETMYLLWAVHACALFDVVRFNLKLITCKYTTNKEEAITLCNDSNYEKICYCITIHQEAISFADLIESITSGFFSATIGTITCIIVFTSVQALVNLNHPAVLMQLAAYTIGQVFHLYINLVPGQELINHSQQIHSIVYNLNWPDMSVKTQKLLIPIMLRSNKPCHLTARKLYVLSMESFGSTIRTVISYFTVFAQMI